MTRKPKKDPAAFLTVVEEKHRIETEKRRKHWTKITIFVHERGESVLDQLVARRLRPVEEYRRVVLDELEKLGITDPILSWSQNAGCAMCPCSPGFILQAGESHARLIWEHFGIEPYSTAVIYYSAMWEGPDVVAYHHELSMSIDGMLHLPDAKLHEICRYTQFDVDAARIVLSDRATEANRKEQKEKAIKKAESDLEKAKARHREAVGV